jgi:hypothetical protein
MYTLPYICSFLYTYISRCPYSLSLSFGDIALMLLSKAFSMSFNNNALTGATGAAVLLNDVDGKSSLPDGDIQQSSLPANPTVSKDIADALSKASPQMLQSILSATNEQLASKTQGKAPPPPSHPDDEEKKLAEELQQYKLDKQSWLKQLALTATSGKFTQHNPHIHITPQSTHQHNMQQFLQYQQAQLNDFLSSTNSTQTPYAYSQSNHTNTNQIPTPFPPPPPSHPLPNSNHSPFMYPTPSPPAQPTQYAFNYIPKHLFPLGLYQNQTLSEVLAKSIQSSQKRKFNSIREWKREIQNLTLTAPPHQQHNWLRFLDEGQKIFSQYQLAGLNYFHFEMFQALRDKLIQSPFDPGYMAKISLALLTNHSKKEAHKYNGKGNKRLRNFSARGSCSLHTYAKHTDADCWAQQKRRKTNHYSGFRNPNMFTPPKPHKTFGTKSPLLPKPPSFS